jgi:mono/diheme cytochrome c family protein
MRLVQPSSYRIAALLGLFSCAMFAAKPQQPAAAETPSPASQRAVLDKFCVACHNEKLKTAGLALDKADLDHVGSSAQMWEKVVRKLRAGQMPPVGLPRPDAATYDSLASSLETALDRAAAAKPNPGRASLHRMNRTEYGNAIRDLLGLNVNVSDLLPTDDASYGFDNIADVLTLSPALLERYLSAAGKISRLAVGDPATSPIIETYRVRADVTQNEHIEGLPFGTRGGVRIEHNFPLDGEYVFKVKLLKSTVDLLFGGTAPDELLEIALNGERVQTLRVNPPRPAPPPPAPGEKKEGFDPAAATQLSMSQPPDSVEVRIPVKAGPQVVTVAFLQKTTGLAEDLMEPFLRSTFDPSDPRGLPHVLNVTIAGPFNPKGSGETPSRQKIFICQPKNAADETTCAKRIISNLSRKAYRRPATDGDVETLLSFYQSARNEGGNFENGVEMALRRILASPQFVYRFERDPAETPPDTLYRVGDVELASRLSYFLWSSIPDETLLTLATQGKLKDPAVLEQQVRRMLADPKADTLTTNFASQWLYLRNLRGVAPDLESFPNFDDNLRQAFRRETELFFQSIAREDRSVLDLLNANYTFVNERLARHYGIPNVYGSHFRRVAVTEDARRGLLGQGSILTVTSVATRTSPVQRGKWMLENILGTPPNPPPANVPPLKENAAGGKAQSVRERMEAHRANPTCAACHKVLDPFGFALENFDAIGNWRTLTEAGTPVNAVVQLADGSQVDGPASLRNVLLSRPNVFVGTMTEKMLTYALGRGLDYYDMPTVRKIVRDAAANNYRFSTIVMGIVKSVPFQMRRSESL